MSGCEFHSTSSSSSLLRHLELGGGGGFLGSWLGIGFGAVSGLLCLRLRDILPRPTSDLFPSECGETVLLRVSLLSVPDLFHRLIAVVAL